MSSARPFYILVPLLAACALFLKLHWPGPVSLDGRFFYSPETAYHLIALLGPSGRTAYLVHEIVDLVYLVLYSVTALELSRRYLRARGRELPDWGWGMCLLPGAFDLLETAAIMIALARYPDEPAWLYGLMAQVTPVKWILGGGLVLFLLSLPAWRPGPGARS